ncbi:MAG: hypothetical protein M3P37_02495 [Actinomycetota bacterium]|nr:hypothetical protein [Actinomycetota bacterium]
MEFSWLTLVAAFGGGLFGAAIGALPSFIFTGFTVLVGVAIAFAGSDYDFLTNVAFGPIFGPHIGFAGGVAAAAFAARRGTLDSGGRDIATGLAGLGDPLPLLVGGAFGMLGYLIQYVLMEFLNLASYTDVVALTVFISAVIVRLAFGRTGLFGSLDDESRRRGRFNPGGHRAWVAYQQGWGQAAVIGLGVGAFSAFLAISVAQANPDLAPAGAVIGFGITAASLIFLQFGTSIPVTHHMALPAAVAAGVAAPFGIGAALIIGIIGGILGALVGEFASRLFLVHGDTHIDPPATSIWIMTSIFLIGALLFG